MLWSLLSRLVRDGPGKGSAGWVGHGLGCRARRVGIDEAKSNWQQVASVTGAFQDQFWNKNYLVSFNCVDGGLECDLNKFIWTIPSCSMQQSPFSGAWRSGLTQEEPCVTH